MRSTGIIRKVDGLGRIVIPMEVRRSLEIYENDHVSIGVDGETIVLQRHRPFCAICGNTEGIRTFKSKNVCEECLSLIRQIG